jgi:hypothetical protein
MAAYHENDISVFEKDNVEWKANAKLIIAAPEMLAFIIDMSKRYGNSEWIAGEANRIIQKATT